MNRLFRPPAVLQCCQAEQLPPLLEELVCLYRMFAVLICAASLSWLSSVCQVQSQCGHVRSTFAWRAEDERATESFVQVAAPRSS